MIQYNEGKMKNKEVKMYATNFVALDEKEVFTRFKNLIELRSKVILEIGGSIDDSLLHGVGVSQWISVDPMYQPNDVQPLINSSGSKTNKIKKIFIQIYLIIK